MPTHFVWADYLNERLDGREVFHTTSTVAYRIRNALLAAGAIDPPGWDPDELIHFDELFREAGFITPQHIRATVIEWWRRVPGVIVHPPEGLSDDERTALTAQMQMPRPGQLVEITLPPADGEALADRFVTWLDAASDNGGVFVVR